MPPDEQHDVAAVSPATLATGGWKVADLRANVAAWIAGAGTAPRWALVNIGVNDFATTAQGPYETDLAFVLDAIHTAWPSCRILVSTVWMRGWDAKADEMAGWNANVLASRGPWTAAGDDERVWLKGADDGATNTLDGAHYSTAGQAAKIVATKAAMGY